MGMTDAAAKHLSFSGGGGGGLPIVSDLKTLLSLVRTKRSLAFAYGFMFAFVVFTVFLAFNPSPNSTSPWFFSNIFTAPSPGADTPAGGGSTAAGSQFPSIFSYLFPNSSDAALQMEEDEGGFAAVRTVNASSSPTAGEAGAVRSNSSSSSRSHNGDVKGLPPVSNQTQTSTEHSFVPPPVETQSGNASIVGEEPPAARNTSKTVENSGKVPSFNSTAADTANQTKSAVTPAPNNGNSGESQGKDAVTDQKSPSTAANQTAMSSISDGKGVGDKNSASNLTEKKQSSGGGGGSKQGNKGKTGASVKQGIEALVESLEGCDLFDGEWVMDNSYPLYKPGSCSLIDEQFNCILNGRPDKDYQKYKWKPHGCTLPRFNPGHMLDMLKGKRLAFVGDSLNRNMWESMVCMLKSAAKDQSKVYEANGRQHFRGEAAYSFIFKDYGCTVEFFVTPFLVQEWETINKTGYPKETLRLDLIGKSSDQYKTADYIVFNTGHWWTHEKTSLGKDYYQEGSHVYPTLNVLEAFRKALTTWGRWIDANVNPRKSLVFFRGYSASHFSGGQWNSGGACDNEVEPIKNSTYLTEYPDKMQVLEKVLRGMKTSVKYLNVTRMTDYRKDGHPSIYRKRKITEEERRSPMLYQDCSHWCLPGVPDAWNEVLYAQVLVNEYRKHPVQKKKA
ncbi:unnamed protein product [Linum tenue]|uniref:Trichome birefringence-like N-terminal domain-containing protein n=1 Tax=Linum tenue TaxID=586396 RepID=A0AAV0JBH1_9ROSI|nr:unnamed protein product [Linum tenue]